MPNLHIQDVLWYYPPCTLILSTLEFNCNIKRRHLQMSASMQSTFWNFLAYSLKGDHVYFHELTAREINIVIGFILFAFILSPCFFIPPRGPHCPPGGRRSRIRSCSRRRWRWRWPCRSCCWRSFPSRSWRRRARTPFSGSPESNNTHNVDIHITIWLTRTLCLF